MRVKVEFYDVLRELAGQQEWTPDVSTDTTVADLFSLAQRSFPSLLRFPQEPVFTSGLDYVEPVHVLREGETISILPPPPVI
ncbi:MAG: MoaD/ThiS family protein [Terrimicrobiaceae bacterium]